MAEDNENDPTYDDRLQRRLKILKEELAAGRIVFNSGMQVIESLKAVRYAKDGSVDLSTVDGLVRSVALMAEHVSDRNKLKDSASLIEVQVKYFEYIAGNFENLFKEMVRAEASPHDVARHISRQPEYRKELVQFAPDFLTAIEDFWKNFGSIVHVHLEDMHGPLKCIYGGDLFPSSDENIASKCGIYTDTIILPDPFLRTRDIFSQAGEEQLSYYLVKHALNLLKYRELACAELSPPIVVVAPDYTALEAAEKEFVLNISERDAIFHAERIFGRKFESVQHLLQFADRLDTVEAVVSEIKHPERVVFDVDWSLSLSDSIERALAEPYAKPFAGKPGVFVASNALGRMATANELLIKSRRFGGSPIIDAPTSWRYFTWKLEYDSSRAAESIEGARAVDLHVLKGLQALSEVEMQWIGNVPPEALIEIRRMGALPEIRQMLSTGVDELARVNPTNFYRTADKIFDNIHAAFADHQRKLDDLKAKKWKFATRDVGTWLTVGTIEVAAAITGVPVWGLAAIAANQLTDAPKLKDIPSSIRRLCEENDQVKRSPVGILFKYKK
jgi:hypothetical protein